MWGVKMILFDYDGVIGNTDEGLFDEYDILKQKRKSLTVVQYLVQMNWYEWLRKKGPKRDAFEVLKDHDPDIAPILTRCWSTKEGADKVKYIRENDNKNPINIVPNSLKKSLIICPKGNLLVEDELKNARDWINSGGSALMLDVGPYKECPTIHSIEEAFIYAKEHGFI